ncbi:MAG: EAL domain-containing protein [Chloroflexi bacterium]|nr:EAL domain-containing protein [Chloroflexota bacterium]
MSPDRRGIETDAERRLLQELGVDLGQGYLLGAPSPLRWFPARASQTASRRLPQSGTSGVTILFQSRALCRLDSDPAIRLPARWRRATRRPGFGARRCCHQGHAPQPSAL